MPLEDNLQLDEPLLTEESSGLSADFLLPTLTPESAVTVTGCSSGSSGDIEQRDNLVLPSDFSGSFASDIDEILNNFEKETNQTTEEKKKGTKRKKKRPREYFAAASRLARRRRREEVNHLKTKNWLLEREQIVLRNKVDFLKTQVEY